LLVKKLYVFGAGSSFSATRRNKVQKRAPLDKDFCKHIEQLKATIPTWVGCSQAYLLKEWKDHLPFKDYGLEQAIIKQIGHLDFINAIHPRRRKDDVSTFTYLNHLSHIICYLLRRAREIKYGPYETFFKKVFFPAKKALDVKDRIITFNYDELFDKHLLKKFPVQEIYFDKLKDSRTSSNRRKEKFDHPLLIKLHGSINWQCSTDEFKKIIKASSKDDKRYYIDSVWFSRSGCSSPDDSFSPLIIPPLPQKPITQIELFCFLWTKAFEYLQEAEELIVCGYSLPATDNLAQSLFGNFANKKLKMITIVDTDPLILKKWRDLLRRKNINSSVTWNYYETFEEYVGKI
jgi:hypothetical protein